MGQDQSPLTPTFLAKVLFCDSRRKLTIHVICSPRHKFEETVGLDFSENKKLPFLNQEAMRRSQHLQLKSVLKLYNKSCGMAGVRGTVSEEGGLGSRVPLSN